MYTFAIWLEWGDLLQPQKDKKTSRSIPARLKRHSMSMYQGVPQVGVWHKACAAHVGHNSPHLASIPSLTPCARQRSPHVT